MNQFLKNHKKDFIVWGLVLLIFALVVLIVYFENQDKKHYVNVACNSDINIVDDDINLNKNVLIYNSSVTPSYSDSTISTNADDYLLAFSPDDRFRSEVSSVGQLTIGCATYNLNTIKNYFTNNVLNYYINYDNLFLNFYTNINMYDFDFTTYEYYYGVFVQFSNNSTDYSFVEDNSNYYYNESVRLLDNVTSNIYYSVNLNFNYTYCHIYYYYYIDNGNGGELISTGYEGFESAYVSQGVDSLIIQNSIDSLNRENSSLRDEISSLEDDLAQSQADYNSLDVNYQFLLGQYNTLLNQTDYSFSELFWSISAVPFGVLTSAFNVNVLGVNLAGIITGLFTAMLLIWLFKKFFK